MDERRLRAFLAIVEEGGVTRAAAALHVAQPSLSQTLRALEAELGAALFDRVGRGLRLTAAGAALVGPARQALRALEATRSAVGAVAELAAGRLDVAALATLAVDPLAELIGRFRRAHPGVAVRVLEPDSAARVGTLVREGEAELGLAHLPLARQDLHATVLGEQELLFVLPPDVDVHAERPLTPAALAGIPLLATPPGTSTRILLEQAFAAVRREPAIAVEVASRDALVPLVLAGAGAALLPPAQAREAVRRGALARPARPRIVRRIGLIRRPGTPSPAARAFLALAERGRSRAARRARR